VVYITIYNSIYYNLIKVNDFDILFSYMLIKEKPHQSEAFLLLVPLSLDYSENTVSAPPPGAALYLVSSA
jgi:hypothetical protein